MYKWGIALVLAVVMLALMIPVAIFAAPMAPSQQQDHVAMLSTVSAGSVDPGGGMWVVYTLTVTTTSFGSEDLGAITTPQYNPIFPIDSQQENLVCVNASNGNANGITNALGQQNTMNVTIDAGQPLGLASQFACSKSFDGTNNLSGVLPTTTGTLVRSAALVRVRGNGNFV